MNRNAWAVPFAVVGVLLASEARAAETAMAAFGRLCVATRADHARALQLADASGWGPTATTEDTPEPGLEAPARKGELPPRMLLKLFGLEGIADADSRMMVLQEGMTLLLTKHDTMTVGDRRRPIDVCALGVVTGPGSAQAIGNAAGQLASVDPDPSEQDASIFIWRDGPRGHERVSVEDFLKGSDPSTSMLLVQARPPLVVLAFVIPTNTH
jgi:hypothetical protein